MGVTVVVMKTVVVVVISMVMVVPSSSLKVGYGSKVATRYDVPVTHRVVDVVVVVRFRYGGNVGIVMLVVAVLLDVAGSSPQHAVSTVVGHIAVESGTDAEVPV